MIEADGAWVAPGFVDVHTDVDKFRLQADPGLLRDLATLVADALPSDTDVLVGMELGGVPLATAVSLHTGLPWALLRRTP